jgi:aspartate 1-decarboxylase
MALNINTSLLLIVPFIFFAHSFLACTEDSEAPQEKKSIPNISSTLSDVMNYLESNSSKKDQILSYNGNAARISKEGQIQIYIRLYEIDESKIEELKKHGVAIDIYDNKQKLIQGWASPHQIKIISELPYVKTIDLPTYGVSN